MKKSRILQLDGLRVVMMAIIVLSHMEFLYHGNQYSYGEFYRRFLHNAVPGVDFFFLLSGFGLAFRDAVAVGDQTACGTGWLKSILRESISSVRNLVRKVYPVYILSILLCVPYEIWDCLQKMTVGETATHVVGSLILTSTMLQSLFGISRYSHLLNGVCWFLSTQVICYFFCPLLLRAVRKMKSNRQIILSILVTMIAEIGITRFLWKIELQGTFDDLTYGSPFARILYLLLGMEIAKLYQNVHDRIKSFLPEYFAILLFFLWFLGRNTVDRAVWKLRVVDLIVGCILLFTIACGKGIFSRLLAYKRISGLGGVMLYVYLFHYPIRKYVGAVFEHYGPFSAKRIGIVEVILIVGLTVPMVYFVRKMMSGNKRSN